MFANTEDFKAYLYYLCLLFDQNYRKFKINYAVANVILQLLIVIN